MLGIAPVLDRRPAWSRAATGPRLRFSWLGVAREREVEGSPFDEDAPRVERRAALTALAASGAFRSVRAVAGPGVEPGIDYLLELEIEEGVGTARERWDLGLLRLGFLRRETSPAVGRARLRARLHDPGGALVHDSTLERQVELGSGDARRAAQDALALAHEELGVRLWRSLRASVPRPERRIPVRVLDGCDLGAAPAGALVEETSAIFERAAGLRLEPRVERWDSRCASADGPSCLAAAREVAAPTGGFVVALAPATSPVAESLRGPRRGLAVQLGEHTWLFCSPGHRVRVSTLAHEIAHLFGAVHSEERYSIMHPTDVFDGRFFDAHNGDALLLARARPFGGSIPAELLQLLDSLHVRARPRGAAHLSAVRDTIRP